LQDLVEQLLESSYDISRRLHSIENSCDSQTTLTRYLTNDSTEPTEVDNSSIAPDAMDMNDVGLKSFDFQFTTTELTVTETMAIDSTTTESTTTEVSFENDLKLSRVYSRTQLYKSDVSFTSSAVRTHAWSVYSGLSLAEASVISAVALPLYSHDISNSHWYKFGDGNQTDLHRPKPVSNALPTLSEARNPLRKSTSAVSKIRNYASELRPFPRRKSAPSGRSEVSKMRLHKLVVLGDGGVGKDELINQVCLHFQNLISVLTLLQLCLKIFIESYDAPIEDSFRKQITIDGEPCMLEVLDTAGQEEYTALRDQWIRDGEGFVLVYSVCNRSSFTKIRKFHHQVSKAKESVISEFFNLPYVPMMIVGNNCDRISEREVSALEGHALARELGCEFVETSAKSGINVEKAFFDVVRLLRRRRR
jgi:GTPase KRas protein